MAIEKIVMFQMAVTDMAKSKTFYADQLGFQVTQDYGEGDRHWVSLNAPGGGTSITLTTMHGKMKPGTMQLYVSTPDIEAAYQDIKAKGVQPGTEIKDDLYGPGSNVKWFSTKDPDGSVVMIVQS